MSKIDGFKAMIERVKQAYPGASAFATMLREVVDANRHLWGAIVAAGEQWRSRAAGRMHRRRALYDQTLNRPACGEERPEKDDDPALTVSMILIGQIG